MTTTDSSAPTAVVHGYAATSSGTGAISRSGSQRDKDNINARVIRPAVRRANERRARRDLPPLPAKVTAHTPAADLHLDDVSRPARRSLTSWHRSAMTTRS